nr:transposase, MuDR [Tanacetum cinerariifolium]
NHPIAFTLKINHGGTLTSPPNVRYRGGKANWFDDVDADSFSAIEVQTMGKDLGYVSKDLQFYYKIPNSNLDIGLKPLSCDKDVMEMCNYVSKCKIKTLIRIDLVDRSNTDKTPMVIEEVDGTGYSDDSNFDVGEEDRIEDVEIRMRAECRGLVPVFGNGPGDSGLGDSGPVCDKPKLDNGSNKKTKKKGQVEDSIKCPWLLHCSKSKNAETWWVKRLNDNHTCLQSRTVGKCTASFLSKKVKETIKPNPKVPISALKDQLQKKYELGMSDMKMTWSCSETQTSPSYQIGKRGEQYKDLLWRCASTTTVQRFGKTMEEIKKSNKEMYEWLKVIPPHHWARSHFSGNGKSLACLASMQCLPFRIWQAIDNTIILTPPNYKPPIAKPSRKRRKSAAEIYDGLVKRTGLQKTQKKVAPKPTDAVTKKKVVPNAKDLSFDVFGYQTYDIIRQLVM